MWWRFLPRYNSKLKCLWNFSRRCYSYLTEWSKFRGEISHMRPIQGEKRQLFTVLPQGRGAPLPGEKKCNPMCRFLWNPPLPSFKTWTLHCCVGCSYCPLTCISPQYSSVSAAPSMVIFIHMYIILSLWLSSICIHVKNKYLVSSSCFR